MIGIFLLVHERMLSKDVEALFKSQVKRCEVGLSDRPGRDLFGMLHAGYSLLIIHSTFYEGGMAA